MKHRYEANVDVYHLSHILSSLSFCFLLFFVPFQSGVCNEFENWPISFALTEMSLSGGRRSGGGGHCGTVIYFLYSNTVINTFSSGEPVTRLFGVRSRSMHLHVVQRIGFIHLYAFILHLYSFYCIS